MLDDLKELRTFEKILNTGSMSRAARELGTSVAVVSKRLATLEKRAGVRLINRTTRALSPTEEGARFLIHVETALESLSAAEQSLVSERDEPVGLLRVSAPVTFGRSHVAPLLGELSKQYVKMSVSLSLVDYVSDLVGEGIDIAVRLGWPAENSAVVRKLADNHRILVASPEYLLRAGRPSHPNELKSHNLLGHTKISLAWILTDATAEKFAIAPEARFRADSGDAIHDWALAGYGIMNKSIVDVSRDIAEGRLERVLPAWTAGERPVVALYPSAKYLPVKTRVFLDAIAKRLQRIIF